MSRVKRQLTFLVGRRAGICAKSRRVAAYGFTCGCAGILVPSILPREAVARSRARRNISFGFEVYSTYRMYVSIYCRLQT